MFDSLAALETSALRDVVFAVLDMARWCSWVQESSERGEIRHQVASVCARVDLTVSGPGGVFCVCRIKSSEPLKRTTRDDGIGGRFAYNLSTPGQSGMAVVYSSELYIGNLSG